MTAPDWTTAVQIAAAALGYETHGPTGGARAVVAALDEAKLLHDPAYVAALEKVAGAAREYRVMLSAPFGGSAIPELEALERALDAVPEPAAETGSGECAARTYDQLTEQEGGPPNERIGERTAGETGSGEAREYFDDLSRQAAPERTANP